MSAHVIVEVEVKDPERYANYKTMVPARLGAYGGKICCASGGEAQAASIDVTDVRSVGALVELAVSGVTR